MSSPGDLNPAQLPKPHTSSSPSASPTSRTPTPATPEAARIQRSPTASSAKTNSVSLSVKRAIGLGLAKRNRFSSAARRVIGLAPVYNAPAPTPANDPIPTRISCTTTSLPVTHATLEPSPGKTHTIPKEEDGHFKWHISPNSDTPMESVDSSAEASEQVPTAESVDAAANIVEEASRTMITARARGFIAIGGGNISVSNVNLTVVSDRSAMLAGVDGPNARIKFTKNTMIGKVTGNENGAAHGLIGLGGGVVECHDCETAVESSGFATGALSDQASNVNLKGGKATVVAMREL